MKSSLKQTIRWLTFDVMGTCVDWRTSLSDDGVRLWTSLALPLPLDGNALALNWESAYASGIGHANSPGPWEPAARIIRAGLDRAVASLGFAPLSDHDAHELCEIWDRLRPWPDVRGGLEAIRKGGRAISTLSNFGRRTLDSISAHGDLT